MQMEGVYASAASSISHVYGNVAKALEVRLKSILPDGLIKDSTISTRVAYRHFQRRRSRLRRDDTLSRKEKPFLILRPSIEMINPNDEIFLNGTHYTENDGLLIGPGNDIQEFMEDKQRGYGVGFKINRFRLTFDVELQLSTEYSAYDLYHYLRNNDKIKWERVMYMKTPLESMIPKNILLTLGNYIGLDITDDNNIPAFLAYMRSHASYPITYMMRNSTSQNEYFVYYNHNILVTFSDLNASEAEKKGMITDSASVTFKVACDFNIIGNYYLYGKASIKRNIQSCIHFMDKPINHGAYVPIFTYNIDNFDNEFYLKGFTQYSNSIIRTEAANDGKDDSFSFRSCFDQEDYQVCLDYMAHENPITLLFDVKLVKENYDLDPDVDWDINWSTLTVTIHNSDKFATYRFIMYVNLNLLNSRKLETNYQKTDQQTLDPKTNHGYNL